MAGFGSPIDFLFRYRDLVAPTLTEHRKIRDAKGKVWWGWWKRPTEDPRYSVWNRLANRLVSDSPVPIGLFDSGQDDPHRAVTLALVDKVLAPPDWPDGTSPVELPSTEDSELVPAYYRAQPFSRAWLRLSDIAQAPLEFFGSYSYAAAPLSAGTHKRPWIG